MAKVTQGRPQDTSRSDLLAAVATRALALQEVGLALASSEALEGMAAAFLPVAAGAVGASEAALLIAEGPGGFRTVARHGVAQDVKETLDESLVEQAATSVASESEEPALRDSILEDESFLEWCREQGLEEGEARRPYFELYAPLRAHETVIGILALGRRSDGADFNADDLALVDHVGSSAAVAVRRCVLEEENHRKLELLRALSRFTSEITSTLDLNRVLQTVANTTEAVIERDRACVALLDAGTLKIRAVSDKLTVEINEAEVLGMAEVLTVLLRHRARLRVTAEAVAGDEAVPGREIFRRYFESGEMQSLLALPLQDEESLLGYLILESRNPDGFSDPSAEESLGILSGAVTVAIRNADLYRRVPMVGFLGPLATQRRRLAAMTPRRRAILFGALAVAVLLVAVVPWPRQAAGPASVRPVEVLPVTVLAPGVVEEIYARSGERVLAGAPIAVIRNRESDARIASAQADFEIAQRRAAEASERRDPAEAQRWNLEARNLAAWMTYARSQGQEHRLTSPVTGSVLTERMEEQVGVFLDRGDVLCEIARLDPAHVEVEVSEEEIGAVHPGGKARLKVLAYPDRQFPGRILAIAPEGVVTPGKPAIFRVTVECPNADLDLLPGMSGRVKLDAGRSSLLGNVVRPLVRAARMKFWF